MVLQRVNDVVHQSTMVDGFEAVAIRVLGTKKRDSNASFVVTADNQIALALVNLCVIRMYV